VLNNDTVQCGLNRIGMDPSTASDGHKSLQIERMFEFFHQKNVQEQIISFLQENFAVVGGVGAVVLLVLIGMAMYFRGGSNPHKNADMRGKVRTGRLL